MKITLTAIFMITITVVVKMNILIRHYRTIAIISQMMISQLMKHIATMFQLMMIIVVAITIKHHTVISLTQRSPDYGCNCDCQCDIAEPECEGRPFYEKTCICEENSSLFRDGKQWSKNCTTTVKITKNFRSR